MFDHLDNNKDGMFMAKTAFVEAFDASGLLILKAAGDNNFDIICPERPSTQL